jgi:hypothetical protein
MEKPIITPKTKVGELLDAFPQLEGSLIEMAPAFIKLRNPLLRRTIARVATLQQAALTGDVPVGELVRRLREEAGQSTERGTEGERSHVPPAQAVLTGTAAASRAVHANGNGTHPRIAAGDPPPPGHEPPDSREPRPDWAATDAIAERVDATDLLDKGANPLAAVMGTIPRMSGGGLLHMQAPFYPAPMVDALRAQGHSVWAEELSAGWALWIRKR